MIMVLRIRKNHLFVAASILLLISIIAGVHAESIAVNTETDKKLQDLPVVMYHQITKSSSRVGKYTIMLEQLQRDFEYLKNHGYSPITVGQLLNHLDNGEKLPEKPIMLTFDDGFESVYAYVLPLLVEYDFYAIASVVGSFVDNATEEDDHNLLYSCLNWEEVNELVHSGRVEIQSHSFNLHKITKARNGAKKNSSESAGDYRDFLSKDLMQMQDKTEECSGYRPTAFTYPFGSYSPESKEILKDLGFRAAFVCFEKINKINPENEDWLFRLCRYNRPHGPGSEAFFKKMGVE